MNHVVRLLGVLALLMCAACVRQVEGTGRWQPAFTSDAEMNKLGEQAYVETLKEETVSTNAEGIALLERVGQRLAAVAPDRHFVYQFTLIESPTINAFCLPGGKVAVYTGILALCENEAGLAAVLGHEIAHAIADHGNERMSQGVLVEGSQQALGLVLQAKGVEQNTMTLTMTAVGLGAQLGVMLPFSRKHETEADYLGLRYMAAAGYDPEEAVKFWTRFATLGNGGQPSWLSTHPASEDRAAALAKALPEARALYAAATQQHGAGALVPAAYRK